MDKDLLRYTGCLVGLGHHEKATAAFSTPYSMGTAAHLGYNPDHDMEIEFDSIIDNEDIVNINKIRYYICLALSRMDDGQRVAAPDGVAARPASFQATLRLSAENSMIEFQDQIKQAFETLLNRQRTLKSKEMSKLEYKWGQMNEVNYRGLQPLTTPITEEERNFLKMITAATLYDRDLERAEEIYEDIKRLKRLAGAQNDIGIDIACPVCPGYVKMLKSSEAKNHIVSAEHQASLAKIRAKLDVDPDVV